MCTAARQAARLRPRIPDIQREARAHGARELAVRLLGGLHLKRLRALLWAGRVARARHLLWEPPPACRSEQGEWPRQAPHSLQAVASFGAQPGAGAGEGTTKASVNPCRPRLESADGCLVTSLRFDSLEGNMVLTRAQPAHLCPERPRPGWLLLCAQHGALVLRCPRAAALHTPRRALRRWRTPQTAARGRTVRAPAPASWHSSPAALQVCACTGQLLISTLHKVCHFQAKSCTACKLVPSACAPLKSSARL